MSDLNKIDWSKAPEWAVDVRDAREVNGLGLIFTNGDKRYVEIECAIYYPDRGLKDHFGLIMKSKIIETDSGVIRRSITPNAQSKIIKRGSVIREYKYGTYLESTVFTDVVKNERGQIEFKSITDSDTIIEYMKAESSLVLVCQTK